MPNVEQDLRLTGTDVIVQAPARIYYSGAFKKRFNANLPYLSGTLVLAVCSSVVRSWSGHHSVKHKHVFYVTQPNRRKPAWVYQVVTDSFDRYLFESPYFHSFRGEVR